MKSIIYQGAESIIYDKKNSVLKDRIKKSYRLNILDDKIRKQRTKKEVKILQKLQNVIPVPKVIKEEKYKIEMEKINGKKLSNMLDALKSSKKICEKIGENIAKMHDANIIHGDLTTSNMILNKDKVYFIDFGLGFHSGKIEDKAVDLRLIKQALEAKHHAKAKEFFASIIKRYNLSKNSKEVLKRLKVVESRGRYKLQY